VVKDADGVRRVIGVIPQAMTSDTELSVEENLLIFSKLYGVPRARRKKLIDDLLEAVDLTEWRDKQVILSAACAAASRLPGPGTSRDLPGRTDHGTRSGLARRGVGDDPEGQAKADLRCC
jgi:hypothetical protein